MTLSRFGLVLALERNECLLLNLIYMFCFVRRLGLLLLPCLRDLATVKRVVGTSNFQTSGQ